MLPLPNPSPPRDFSGRGVVPRVRARSSAPPGAASWWWRGPVPSGYVPSPRAVLLPRLLAGLLRPALFAARVALLRPPPVACARDLACLPTARARDFVRFPVARAVALCFAAGRFTFFAARRDFAADAEAPRRVRADVLAVPAVAAAAPTVAINDS